ncbi:hypothetical protein D3C73_881010 [compost metagenome]
MHQKIQVGFLDRFVGADPDQAAIAPQDGREGQVVEEGHALDAGAAELVRRRQADRQLALSHCGGIHQGDLRAQRLIQCRVQGDFTEAQRRHPGRISNSGTGQQQPGAKPYNQ